MRNIVIAAAFAWSFAAAGQEPQPLQPVTLTVEVVDEAGAPVAGAEVDCVVWVRDWTGHPVPFRQEPVREGERAKTGADGLCRFEGLTEEEYYLHAFSGDLSALERVYPHQSRTNPARLTLKPLPRVNGFVRSHTGEPLEGVLVLAYARLPLAVTGPDGRFDVPDDASSIEFIKPGFGFLHYEFPGNDSEFVLFPETIVEGTVLDDQGNPAPGAKVQYLELEIAADNEGKFRTFGLSRDEQVNFNANYRTDAGQWSGGTSAEIGAGPTQPLEIRMKKTAEAVPQARRMPAPGDIVFASFAEVQAEPEMRPLNVTTVSGKVLTAETKQPVPARVYWGYSQEFLRRGPHTDADGSFKIENVTKNGAPYIEVRPLDPTQHVLEGVVQVPVKEEPVENILFTVLPGSVVRGKLVDSEGKPAPPQWVALSGAGGVFPLQTHTHEDGTFEFENLPAGRAFTIEAGDKSVEIPAPNPGQVVEGVEVQLPSPTAGFAVEGTVVDTNGAPAGGVDVLLRKEIGGQQPLFEHPKTDARGRFTLRLKQGGDWKVESVYRSTFIKMGTINERSGRECPIVEGNTFTTSEGAEPTPVRVVVQMPPREIPLISGTVEDSEGHPLKPELDVLAEKSYSRQERVGTGYFMVYPLPEGAFMLEVRLKGYKPRVLQLGRDFEAGARNVKIILEKGPFKDDENIWTAVTGLPDTEEATQQLLKGQDIRARIEQYRNEAGPEKPVQQPVSQSPRPPENVNIAVTNLRGEPITSITVQQAVAIGESYDYTRNLQQNAVVPASNSPRQVLQNNDGRYTVPNGSFVQAEGAARKLVHVGAYAPPEEKTGVLPVTLGPPATLTVRVLNEEGRPVKAAWLLPAQAYRPWQPGGYGSAGIFQTNAEGKVEVRDLPAGVYLYAVLPAGNPGDPNVQPMAPYVSARLDWGQHVEREFVFRNEKILREWGEHMYQMEELRKRVEQLDKAQRDDLERLVLERLENMPYIDPTTGNSIRTLATAAEVLDLKKAAEPIRAMLSTPAPDPMISREWEAQALVSALASIQGDKAVDFLARLAADDNAHWQVRQWAAIGLGRIGSEKATKAFATLRDAAYAKPGAPAKLESYTHDERMNEAAYMTFCIIARPSYGSIPTPEQAHRDAWVSEDYSEGTLQWGNDTLHMKRIGDEWLIADIERGPVP